MRHNIMIFCIALVTMLLCCGLGFRLFRQWNSSVPSPSPTQNVDVLERPVSAIEKQRYEHLPVMFGLENPTRSGRIGFFERASRTFYAWRGVYLDPRTIPGYLGSISGGDLLRLDSLTIIEVYPDVFYSQLPNDHYIPGFYVSSLRIFYKWRNCEIPKVAIPKSAFDEGRVLRAATQADFQDIDCPPELKQHPAQWRVSDR